MKRDFSQVIRDLDGKPVTNGLTLEGMMRAVDSVLEKLPEDMRKQLVDAINAESAGAVTLRSMSLSALLAPYKDEDSHGDEERMSRMKLAEKIHGADGEVDLEPAERDRLKKLIAKRFTGVLVPVRAARMLEGE